MEALFVNPPSKGVVNHFMGDSLPRGLQHELGAFASDRVVQPIMMMIPCLLLVLVPILAVKVAVEAALTLNTPALIFINDAALRLNLPSAAALVLVLLSLHVAEERSLPRRVVEGRGPPCFGAAGFLGRHGQVLRAHLLVPTRGDLLVGLQDR